MLADQRPSAVPRFGHPNTAWPSIGQQRII